MPFFALTISHIAVSHLSKPIGLSSMIVPSLTLKCFLQAKQIQIRRVLTNEWRSDPQRGQVITPSRQRIQTIQPNAVSRLEKYLKASIKGFRNVSFIIGRIY